MSLSSATIIPSSTFRHISVMVFFMSLLMGLCAFGLISVTSIISGWTKDIEDSMTVEIPAFDEATQTIFDEATIMQKTDMVLAAVNNDPSVIDIEPFKPTSDTVLDERFEIPSPVFLTLHLHPDRAANSEERIKNAIEEQTPNAIIKTTNEWTKDIKTTANTLYFIFMGLMVCVLIVTAFVVAGVVRTQLIASSETITLIHLTGASSTQISHLFQSVIIKTVIKGCVISAIALGVLIAPLIAFLDYDGPAFYYWATLPFVVALFVALAMMVTSYTVTTALKDMP